MVVRACPASFSLLAVLLCAFGSLNVTVAGSGVDPNAHSPHHHDECLASAGDATAVRSQPCNAMLQAAVQVVGAQLTAVSEEGVQEPAKEEAHADPGSKAEKPVADPPVQTTAASEKVEATAALTKTSPQPSEAPAKSAHEEAAAAAAAPATKPEPAEAAPAKPKPEPAEAEEPAAKPGPAEVAAEAPAAKPGPEVAGETPAAKPGPEEASPAGKPGPEAAAAKPGPEEAKEVAGHSTEHSDAGHPAGGHGGEHAGEAATESSLPDPAEMFEGADLDGDDKIDKKEFVKFVSSEMFGDTMATTHKGAGEDAGIRIALSITMISMVAVTMFLFYMTNWPDPDISRATWSIVSATLTIFCAIVAFSALKEVSMGILNEPEQFFEHEFSNEEPSMAVLFHHVIRALVLTLMLYVMLYALRSRPTAMEVVGGIGAHIVGFALIEAFGTLQLKTPFIYHPFMSLVVLILAATVIFGVVAVGTMARQIHLQDAEHDRFREALEEAENDYTGLAMGLLLCQVIKFMITGHMAPIHGAPKGKTIEEVLMLAAAAIGMAGVVVGVSAVNNFLVVEHAADGKPWIQRMSQIGERMASMALGWNMLYTGEWCFWTLTGGGGVAGGDDMIAGMLMLVAFGLVGFALIFVFDYLARWDIIQRPAMESLINGISLALALTWEITVDTSVQSMHTVLPHHGARFLDAAVDVFLCTLVIPAQVLYILPKAKTAHEWFSEKD